jgi:hypothetical protein
LQFHLSLICFTIFVVPVTAVGRLAAEAAEQKDAAHSSAVSTCCVLTCKQLATCTPTRFFLLPLQTVDRFNNLFVTAYVTPGNARFLLLHDGKSDDAIRGFFTEVQELYLRVSD